MPVDMKLMISSAFAQMARQKPIDKITVKDLVEQCGISRQTFYYHFQDILEVMEWSIRQTIQRALQRSLQAETPQKAIEAFISVSAEQSDLLLRLLSSQRRAQIEEIFVEAMRSSIRQMIFSKKPDLSVNHQSFELALNFYAYGISGVIFESCKNSDMNPKQLSEQLYQLFSKDFMEQPS